CPCDFLDPSVCLHPFPNDYFTKADPTTGTARRVNLALVAMPRNAAGKPIDPTDYNRSDGFSPGAAIVLRVPGVDLGVTRAVPITNIARSLDPNAPIVLVNADTLAHHLFWAEIDSNASSEATRAILLHPAVNLADGTRYIVALRRMKDSTGALITPNPDFVAYRDGIATGDPVKEARRAHMESLFTTLARYVLGVAGLPLHQPTPQQAPFICNIPRAALANATASATPARPSLYGHGLFGTNSEVNAGNVESMANEHNFVFCATNWIGM